MPNPLRELIERAYRTLIAAASLLQSPLLLALRLYFGWQFYLSGKGKLGDPATFADLFAKWGIPFPKLNVYLAGTTECVGGLLLLVGLASRLISVPLAFTMIVAYATADSEALKSIFSDPDKFTGATPFLYLLTVVIVLAFGPGVFSLDWLIGRKVGRSDYQR